ncbi:DUF1273 domain-containing protein [Clostridium botulinum]|uniref:DUF1273 domain-containing protein n=1 Tax=Clostridium botulinum TaxID=1491 RepID=A0AA44BST0_CLOBO|nr:DUF1273 domain-containing protein [Clostridium botulinum]NFI23451.1 DUF1273 domain-containing protein [Clostridium botulinum]NFQ80294.1 DUF1273 domain-containing protein [Clostridium botulinum]
MIVCFTAHRPHLLYGYELSNKKYQLLAKKIREICIMLIERYSVDTFITGGALGGDTVAFFVVENLKIRYPCIKNILAIPFKNQPNKWNDIDRERYRRMLNLADELVYVDALDRYKISKIEKDTYNIRKLQVRNRYMVDCSNYVIAIYNGNCKGGTYNCIQYAKKQNKTIITLNPITLREGKMKFS